MGHLATGRPWLRPLSRHSENRTTCCRRTAVPGPDTCARRHHLLVPACRHNVPHGSVRIQRLKHGGDADLQLKLAEGLRASPLKGARLARQVVNHLPLVQVGDHGVPLCGVFHGREKFAEKLLHIMLLKGTRIGPPERMGQLFGCARGLGDQGNGSARHQRAASCSRKSAMHTLCPA